MNREVARVPFHGMDILTIKENDEIYVAMKDVCNGLGVDWSAQRQRIMRHELLSTCVVKITTQVFDDHQKIGANPVLGPAWYICTTQVPGDNQQREILTLPIQYLSGWLMTINTTKVKESIRESLIDYQRECYKVLHNYWTKGIAINPRKVAEFVDLQNLAGRLRVEVSEQHNPVVREHLYVQLRDINDSLGQPTPDIEHFTRKTEASSNVIDLFEYYRILCVKHDVNHSSDPDVIAIEPESFSGLCQRAFQESLPVAELGRQVKESVEYPYIASDYITSCITGQIVYCWIFGTKKPPFPEARSLTNLQ